MKDPSTYPRYRACGDSGLLVELGNAIDPAVHRQVMQLFRAMKAKHISGILDMIPAYASLVVQIDPWRISFERLRMEIDEAFADAADREQEPPEREDGRIVDIPVFYGGTDGPDLEEVCRYHGLSATDVIALHTAPLYTVYMIGFTPGFPYLGGLDPRLITPRRTTPRKRVPAGSVGIADRQTGIYSIDSPGGWQLIGRTPLRLFDPMSDRPFLLEPGDRIRFVPISTRQEIFP
ncbi:MAG: 5-oxoprolinase subunit PxpB [Thermodesulfobacteriota bacterium]